MRKLMLGALGAATIMLTSVPAWSQELPVKSGDFWDVAAITIDDGHFPDYVDFLASDFNALHKRHGRLFGTRIPRPKLLPLSEGRAAS